MATFDLLLRAATFTLAFAVAVAILLRPGRRRAHAYAAFAVGGIGEWLTPGQNGHLAPGNPPTVEGLTAAIVACLKDPQTHARLREGAGHRSADFSFDAHVDLLLQAFNDAARAA